MAKNVRDRLSMVIDEVESIAKRLRQDIRKAATASGVERRIQSAARRLQKQAALAALQVERYVRQVRLGLERSGSKATRKRRGLAKAAS
jgi:hypothetical protein